MRSFSPQGWGNPYDRHSGAAGVAVDGNVFLTSRGHNTNSGLANPRAGCQNEDACPVRLGSVPASCKLVATRTHLEGVVHGDPFSVPPGGSACTADYCPLALASSACPGQGSS